MRITLTIILAIVSCGFGVLKAQTSPTTQLDSNQSRILAQPLRSTNVQRSAQNNNQQLIFNSVVLAGKGNGGIGKHGGTGGGGDEQCVAVSPPLTALVPMRQGRSIITPTSQPSPTLWFYVPYESQRLTTEFSLRNTQNQRIRPYKVTYSLPGRRGIIGINLPSSQLQPNQSYAWELRVICSKTNPSVNPVVDGVIERINAKPGLPSSRDAAIPSAIRYAQEGLWYETLTTIITKVRPTNSQKASAFMRDLLQAYELDNLASQPIVRIYPPAR